MIKMENVMGRIAKAWSALLGRPIENILPPVQMLNLEPDDQIFFECEGHLSDDARNKLRAEIEAWLEGESRRVVVLCGGIRLVAVRKTNKNGEIN